MIAHATIERRELRAVTVNLRNAQARTPLVATGDERIALPHRQFLEERFGRPLDTIEVYASPRVAGVLGALHAVSATRNNQIFLASPSAPLSVVAHEVAHALQAGRTREPFVSGVEPADSRAEREASVIAAEVARPGRFAAQVSVGEGIGRDTLALLRVPSHRTGDEITLRAPSTAPVRPAGVEGAPAPAPANLATVPTPASLSGPQQEEGVELPPAPELTVSAEQVAAQQAVIAEAEAALAAAATPAELLRAYAAAPPTVKARQAASLGADVASVAATEAGTWQSDIPALHASLAGAEPPAAEVPVLAPPARQVELGTAPAPTPEPDIPEVEVPGPFAVSRDAALAFNGLSEPDPQTLAAQIGDSLDSVQTVDPDVPRSPGPPPAIPLGGATDPARVAEIESAGRAEAAGVRDEAVQAVISGPGPERVQPMAMKENFAVGDLPSAAIGVAPAPEGPDVYTSMELPPEVRVAFDEQQHAAMEASMAQTVAQAEQATSDRDAAKETAVTEAETAASRLSAAADGEQAAAVLDARTDIQTARQGTIDAQQAEVARVEREAGEQRRSDEAAIQTRVADDQQKIETSYAAAETRIGEEVAAGERQAAAKKAEAEREAEDQSWWDRAVSFVKDAFNALVDAIGAVFDAVRNAVNGILDAVKAAALALIDAVAGFIKDAIAAFGALLKAAITGLIGQIFPELAAKLNAAIDSAVAAAQRAVDVVADRLKAGVSALVEGLRAGLMAIIDTFQAALTLALSVAAAAITGDWGALALRVLEAVLRLIGVDPEEFYAFVGRAQETFQMIIDDPAGFLGNILAAVGGGIQRFADNIVTHLQTGVIGWLTGALGSAGIALPQTFDLLGVLDLARQILGLTWELLKARARRLIGERNVERLEAAFGFIDTLIAEGWGGLWARIMESVSNVFTVVFDGIKNFIKERVIMAAITKMASLFSPVGAIVQLVLTAWNIYTFLRDQLSRIAELVQTVVNAIGDIARGVLDTAKAAVEGVLVRLLPLAIDLLARLIGLGNVGGRVREIIEDVRAMIDRGIDMMLQRITAAFNGRGAASEAAASVGPRSMDATRVTAAGHAAFAKAAASRLERDAAGISDFTALQTSAAALEHTLSAQLEPGIGLRFLFTGGATDAKDGVVDVEVVIAPNNTTLPTQISLVLGSAPGIGDERPHASQDPRHWSGPELLHHTVSEHIIPYAIGDALLAVAAVSRGSREASHKFDGALTTVMIYRGAARRKTHDQGADIDLISAFRTQAVEAGIAKRLSPGAVWAAGTGRGGSDDSVDALAQVFSAIERYRVDAVARTNRAILEEHAEVAAGYSTTNGQRRGEPTAIPDSQAIGRVSRRQAKEIVVFARHLFTASGGPSARPRRPEDNPGGLETVTLEQLNGMTMVGEFKLIPRVSDALAQRLLAAKPFASRDDLGRVPGIGPAFMARVVG